MERTVDAVVIGGGPAGYVSALRLAQLGLKPLLVERGELGGTCTNRGCIPTKSLIHAAKVFRDARHGERMGIRAEGISVDFIQLQEWNRFVVEKVRRGIDHLLNSNGVEVLKGEAVFTSPDSLLVRPAGETLRTRKVLIATGSRPSDLPRLRFDSKKILSSDDIFGICDLPRDLVIVGGGVIGVEMATAFAYLGSRVTIIELMDQILPGFQADLVRPVHDSLTKAGVDINLKCSVEKSFQSDGGRVGLALTDGRTLHADYVLVSVGRRPNTENLSLQAAGVKTDGKGFIKINGRLESSVEGIFAAGDVTGLPYLAHRAMDQGYRAAGSLCSRESPLPEATPTVVYSDPEIAVVGLDERASSSRGLEFITGVYSFASSGRAQTLGRLEGFVKVIGEKGNGRLLGVAIVGSSASELIGGCSAMMNASLTLGDLAAGGFPHPTLSEALMEAARVALRQGSR